MVEKKSTSRLEKISEMNHVKNILIALDGSKNSFKALDMTIYLARQCGATITGLCVVSLQTPVYMPGMLSSYKKSITEQARKFLSTAKKTSAKNGIEFHESIIYGVPSLDIAEYANKKGFDMVVVGAHGHSSVHEFFLGSTAHSTVHKSKVPVVVVK